jgi:hypothetical protein
MSNKTEFPSCEVCSKRVVIKNGKCHFTAFMKLSREVFYHNWCLPDELAVKKKTEEKLSRTNPTLMPL